MSMKRHNKQKRKQNKRIATVITASVLVAALGTVGVFHHMEPMETYAKESFTGTKQVVESHTGDGRPFVILDIVPSFATYEWDEISYEISTGTLGYLVNGQSPMASDYMRIYKEHSADLSTYEKRATLIDAIWKYGNGNDDTFFQYEEAYGSSGNTRKELNTPDVNGWQLLIDPISQLPSGDEKKGETAHSGLMKGYYKKFVEPDPNDPTAEASDKTGYDYIKVGNWSEDEGSGEASQSIYQFEEDKGTYQVRFIAVGGSGSTGLPEGYVAKDRIKITEANINGYHSGTGLYSLNDNGDFVYAGTIASVFQTGRSLSFEEDDDNQELSTTTTTVSNEVNYAIPVSSIYYSTVQQPKAEDGEDEDPDNDGNTENTGNAESNGNTENTGNAESNGNAENTGNVGSNGDAENTGNAESNGDAENTGNAESNGNAENTGNAGSNGDAENTGNAEGNGDAENTGNVGSNGETENTGNPGTEYYVVTFEYASELTKGDERSLYAIESAQKLVPDGSGRPYDLYALNTDSKDSVEIFSDDEEADAQEQAYSSTAVRAVPSNVTTDKVFLYVGAGHGEYKLTDEADLSDADKAKQAPVWMEVRNAPTYFRFNGGCDWLKQYVFHTLSGGDNANDSFRIEVRTIRADLLTQDMIKQADLIYLEGGSTPFINKESQDPKVTFQYITSDTQKVTENGNEVTKGLTRENAYELVFRAAVDLLPVIVDYNAAVNENYSKLNYQGLAKMFLKEDLETYVNDAQTKPDWLFTHLDDSNYPNRTDNGNHFVNRNVYVVNSGTPLVDKDFPDSFDGESAGNGFSEVLNLIRSENSLLPEENRIPENVGKAKAMEYIINYSVGFVADFICLRILELQPTNNEAEDLYVRNDDSTTLYWKRNAIGAIEKPVLRSSKEIDAKVTPKAVAAFNSEWEDINQNYNLVFIGLDGQKLNYEANPWRSTVYNDTSLNNKLYHTGDRAADSDERYDMSDITERKKLELLDFMRAGYPILVENDFFIGKSAKNGVDRINTKYVAEDTQMYDFLKQAVSDFRDRIYTIDDVHSDILFMAQLNIDHPVISVSDTADFTLAEATNGELSVSFTYAIWNRKGDSYGGDCHTEIYLDLNDDGNYTDEERMDNRAGEGAVVRAAAENGQAAIVFTESPGSRAIPFRIRAVDNNNSYRRSSVQGILQVTDGTKEKIKVLQIGTKDDAASLATLYRQENSTLGYYLKAAENTMNIKFAIETMDSEMLSGQLEKNENYLNQWDLLIIGFGNGSDTFPKEAVTAYINEGHSVLVTGKEATDARILDYQLLGQYESRRTYGRLGRSYGSYFRYAGLDAGMFNEQSNLGASGLNEGSVFSYPYAIGKSVALDGGRSYKAYDYLLDLSNLKAPFVTPWFVFTGSGQNAYDISPNDGANNYYLYSRSNVVFIGNDDYSSYTYDVDNPQNPVGKGLKESQMFVNAMMLAYDAGVHNMKVDIVSGFDAGAAEVSSISIPFDQEIETQNGLLDETVDVFFKFKNSNLTLSNAYAVNFYYEDAAGGTSLDVGDEKVQVTPFTSSLWTVQDNTLTEVAASQIRQGKVYRFKAPVIALQNNTAATNAKIYVEVVSALERPDGSEGAGSKEVRGYDSVTFTRTQLFLLE